MSDEKPPAEELPESETAAAPAPAKTSVPPAMIMIFAIMALLGALIVVVLQGREDSGSEEALKQLRAEIDARSAELNRQRISMGLSPLADASEPIDDIAARLKNDADTLVALTNRFQEMLAEKDLLITAKSAEILRSEQLRQTLVAETGRLQAELSRALGAGSDVEALRREMVSLREQRDALAGELEAALEQNKELSGGVAAADFADLKRRYEEAVRAKEFFESRVKELEPQD